MGARWTPAEDQTVIDLTKAGKYAYEIASILGRSTGAVFTRRYTLGVQAKGGRRRMELSEQQGEAIRIARSNGYTWREIAKLTHHDKETVRRAYKRWCDNGLESGTHDRKA